MGGKHKHQSQRTKHNAKPSSSGRSAELLRSTTFSFEGASTTKEACFSVASLPAKEIDVSTMGTNFQFIFKKMNKKDSTTKLKALQEFAELLKQSDPKDVKEVLPFWSSVYGSLATDTNHHVREAVHIAHREIVVRVKRNLAPYIKQLIGPWFTSQYDTYQPAATAASSAFQDAFPSSKIQEALVYCQEEILAYLLDNLTLQSPQAISKAKMMSPEDAEAKYERILISSLQGYSLYLTYVPTEQIQKAGQSNHKIVSSSKFWKLSKHKIIPVRAAWFAAMTTLCQKAMFLLKGDEARICSTVFASLDEREPKVLIHVWESVLVTITSITEWWTHINFEKFLLPKIWRILKEGGHGNASLIYPNILPFISKLPHQLDSVFYSGLFENFRSGLRQKNVLSSKGEIAAIVSSFFECVKYVILSNHTNASLCEKILKSDLVPLIEWGLVEDSAPYEVIFEQTVGLVQYWSFNEAASNYSGYLVLFTQKLSDLFQKIVLRDYEPEFLLEISDRQMCFMHSLKKCTEKISNDVGNNGEVKDCVGSPVFNKVLNELVYNLCNSYITAICDKRDKEFLEPLLLLIKDFGSNDVILHFCKSSADQNKTHNVSALYDNVFSKWLSSDDLRSKQVVDIIFHLLKYLNKADKNRVLDNLTANPECLEWGVETGLSHPFNKDFIVRDWLLKKPVRDYLLFIFNKQLTEDHSPEGSSIIKLALTVNENQDLLISKDVILNVIDQIKLQLLSPRKFTAGNCNLENCISLASDLIPVVYANEVSSVYGQELLLILYSSSYKNDVVQTISKEILIKLNTAWQNAVEFIVEKFPKKYLNETVVKLATFIEDLFLTDNANIELLGNSITNFLRAVYKSSPSHVYEFNDIVEVFFNRKFVSDSKDQISTLCAVVEYVRGNLCCLHDNLFKLADLNIYNPDISNYFLWSIVKLQVLSSKFIADDSSNHDQSVECNVDVAVTEASANEIAVFDVMKDPVQFVLSSFYDFALSLSYTENYKSTKCYKQVKQYNRILEEKISVILKSNSGIANKLSTDLDDILQKESWIWCRVLYLFHSKILPSENLMDIYQTVCQKVTASNRLSMLHITQLFGNHLHYETLPVKDETVAELAVILRSLYCEENATRVQEVLVRGNHVPTASGDVLDSFYQGTAESWKKAQEVIETIRLLATLLKSKPRDLDRKYWDFAVISLDSWSNKVVKMKYDYKQIEVEALLVAILHLFINIQDYVAFLKETDEKNSYICEWSDLFSHAIQKNMIDIWVYLSDTCNSHVFNIRDLPLLNEFGAIVNKCTYKYIFDDTDPSLKWHKLRSHCLKLLESRNYTLQLWAHQMLLALVPDLVALDAKSVSSNTPDKYGLTIKQFEEILCKTEDIVNTILSDFKLGENTCRLEEFTDSFTYVLAYLSLWNILMSLCKNSSTELSYQYADWLKEKTFLKSALNNMFRLMPANIVQDVEAKQKVYGDIFLRDPYLSMTEACSSEEVEHMVCGLYTRTLSCLPVLVRQWWSELEMKSAQFVEKITAAYVSPYLASQELSLVSQYESTFKNMSIKILPAFRELTVIYAVDEAEMELSLVLPPNYPLGVPDVVCIKHVCGASNKQWLMQLKKCMLYQNGRILDGLVLWNKTLNKKFEGVEECYICFGVLHTGTYQLPKLSCHTCKKKFHSACLYKWFSTSNKSTCPICRNLF